MIKLLSAGGTWATWRDGFSADLCRVLAHAGEWDATWDEIMGEVTVFRWEGIEYPASFGPIAGPVDAQSYADSVVLGVEDGVRRINATPGKFVLTGYSQGAEVVRRLQLELVVGRLAHRIDDCLGIVTFGDPARQPTDVTVGGGKGWGISRLIIPANKIRVVTYALPGDMYCTCPDGQVGEQMHAVYVALTNIEIPLGTDLFSAIFSNAGLFRQVTDILEKPISGGVSLIGSLIRLAQFAATNAHGMYGQYIPDAVARVEGWAA